MCRRGSPPSRRRGKKPSDCQRSAMKLNPNRPRAGAGVSEMAAILNRSEFVQFAQSAYDRAEPSGADYTRRSTARRKLIAALREHGVEEVEATADELMGE